MDDAGPRLRRRRWQGLAVPEQRDGVAARLAAAQRGRRPRAHRSAAINQRLLPDVPFGRRGGRACQISSYSPAATAGADSRIARAETTRPRSSARSSPRSSVTTMSAVTPSPCTRRRAWLQARVAQPRTRTDVGCHRHQERHRPSVSTAPATTCTHASRRAGCSRVRWTWIGAVQHRGQLHLGQRLVLAAPDPTDPAEGRTEVRPERRNRS